LHELYYNKIVTIQFKRLKFKGTLPVSIVKKVTAWNKSNNQFFSSLKGLKMIALG